ncbi:MAG: hypothetical protein JWN73_2314 [Betaproteobacteria bacterium]|nr:hypothetical protein [Betaproteobacteria bacterium]
MQGKLQHIAARTRHLFRRIACIAACGSAVLLTACVSGTSADLACKNDSADNALSGDIKGNVVVPRNATCYMKANITGDVNAQDGARIYVLDGTHISGSFRAVGAALVRFNLDGASAAAAGRLGRAAPAKIFVGSNLVVKESRLIGESGIAATEIGGNLVILRNADGGASAGGGHASFSVCTPGMCRPDAAVTVRKSVKIRQNQIAVALNYTSIGADLKCASNDHAPVLMKAQPGAGRVAVKGRKSGQCEHMREVVMAPAPPAIAAPASAAATPKA